MKRFLLILILMTNLGFCFSADAETIQFYQCVNTWDKGFQTFQAKHPEISYEWSDEYYANTSELVGRLLTSELHSDLLGIATTNIDAKQIMKKGFFLDLSDSTVINNMMQQMIPAIADAAMIDGKVYAFPYHVAFDYWKVDQIGWDIAGLDLSCIPHSYPDFLDFLEMWCDRIEKNPENNLRVWNGWDACVYNSSSYTQLLTEILINNVIMQSEFAEQELSFSADELIPLLKRAQVIGQRIYELEPPLQISDLGFGYSLFQPITRPSWPEDSSYIVSMRIHNDQPELVRAIVTMMAVSRATNSPALCTELIEDICTSLADDMKPYLLIHGEAVEKSSYKEDLSKAQQHIDDTIEKLKNKSLEPDRRDQLEQDLESYRKVLELTETNRFLVTPNQVADYQQHANQLYVATPGVFSPGTDGYINVNRLEQQFSSGLIPAEDFLKRLNDIARMVRLEGI